MDQQFLIYRSQPLRKLLYWLPMQCHPPFSGHLATALIQFSINTRANDT